MRQALDCALCDKLVRSAGLIIGYNVLMTDDTGIVIASSDPTRIGTLHEASLDVIKSSRLAYHDAAAARRLAGTLPGMTIPIFMDDGVVGTIGITGSPQEISRFAMLIQRMSEIFLSFHSQQLHSAIADRKRQVLLREIIAFDQRSRPSEAICADAYDLGYDLRASRVAVIAEVLSPGRANAALPDGMEPPGDIPEPLSRLFDDRTDFICPQSASEFVVFASLAGAIPGDGISGLARECEALAASCQDQDDGPAFRFGIGSPAHSPETLRRSYEDALTAIHLLRRRIKQGSCLSIMDAPLTKLATSLSPEVCADAENGAFHRIFRSKHMADTMETVESWCRNRFNFSRTASDLHVHKSTLIYRFRRLKEKYGLNMYDYDCVTALYLVGMRRKLEERRG